MLANNPELRTSLQAITLNNLGCYHYRRNQLVAALKPLQDAAKLEEQSGGWLAALAWVAGQ